MDVDGFNDIFSFQKSIGIKHRVDHHFWGTWFTRWTSANQRYSFDQGPYLLSQGDLKKQKMALVAQGTGRGPAILVVVHWRWWLKGIFQLFFLAPRQLVTEDGYNMPNMLWGQRCWLIFWGDMFPGPDFSGSYRAFGPMAGGPRGPQGWCHVAELWLLPNLPCGDWTCC